jgi:processive 1,2-diacylglycerol beta-glucosyltransferase
VAERPRILVLSASIGEGHDLPARLLADALRERGAEAVVEDGLHVLGRTVERIVLGGAKFETAWGNWSFDFTYFLFSRFPPLRHLSGRLLQLFGARGLLRRVADVRPDVVVSTYPGVTEVIGRLRRAGRLSTPAVSAITDLAALHYWAHPGIDMHLVIHHESEPEVRTIAGEQTRVVAVQGLSDPAFGRSGDGPAARRAFGLAPDGKIVVVSGGGWGVGDLEGAVETALQVDHGITAVVLCGRNDALRDRLARRFDGYPGVKTVGFTTELPDLLAAADALVHSTAGLTVQEALVRGCPVISYGWGRGHIRANNRAYAELGLAHVARDRSELAEALRTALAQRLEPDESYARRPSAADVVIGCCGDGRVASGQHAGHRA